MMKKTLLTLATIVTASFLSMAADCGGSNIIDCTADNADEVCAADQICEFDEGATDGICVLFDPICDVDSDCDLLNSDSPSKEFDCSADSDCDFDGGEVCISNGVAITYCILADSDAPGESCAELSYASATIDGKDVCVKDLNETCSDAGECVAN